MSKLLSLVIGLALGAAVGAALVALYSPATGDKLMRNVRQGYQDTMEEARQASLKRRHELEAELKIRRN